MKRNKKIAITGGIGSGKSTVMKILQNKGYKVYSCDEVYSVLITERAFLAKLCAEFGNILDDNGGFDRKKLSEIVFSDANKLKRLNELTHPAIYQKMFTLAAENNSTCFFEVPLLFEDGKEHLFDEVIVVLRDREKRISEVMKRDNLSMEEVQKRVKNQVDYDNLNFAKYYVIHNNGDLMQLNASVDNILDKII